MQAKNPFAILLRSRKFWLLILDVVVSATLYFVGKYAPVAAEDVKFLIALLQPVFLLLIGSIAYQNVKLAPPQ
jgi:hypothetical protein